MKLTIAQLPGFITSTLAAINAGAWNAREGGGVFVEFGDPAKGDAKVNFQVELVQTLNGISRVTSTTPNAPRVTVTLDSGSTETQVTAPNGPRTTTESASATAETNVTTDTGRTTTGTDATVSNTTSTPTGRTTKTVSSAPSETTSTIYSGSRVTTMTEGEQSNTELTNPVSIQETDQRNQGRDQTQQSFAYVNKTV